MKKAESLAKIKELVDFIYEQTSQEGGYKGAFNPLGTRAYIVSRVMLNKGVLIKSGTTGKPIYSWNPKCMKPTELFYKNVLEEVREIEIGYGKKTVPAKTQKMEIDEKDLGFYVVEYTATQNNGIFHFDPVIMRNGLLRTKHELWSNNYSPIAVVPDDEKIFNLALDFTGKCMGRGFDRKRVMEEISKVLPEQYLWSGKGLDVDLERVKGMKDLVCEAHEIKVLERDGRHNPFRQFTSQQLWDELKKRGYQIEGDKLVYVKKEYLS